MDATCSKLCVISDVAKYRDGVFNSGYSTSYVFIIVIPIWKPQFLTFFLKDMAIGFITYKEIETLRTI